MFRVEHSVLINRPPALVFEFHSNLINHADWHDHILQVEPLTGITQGIGAKFRVVNRVGFMNNTDYREIISYDPPYSYTYKLTTGGVEGTSQQILSEIEGGTQFTVIAEMHPKGIVRLFEPMISKRLDAHIGEAVLELKHYIEANL